MIWSWCSVLPEPFRSWRRGPSLPVARRTVLPRMIGCVPCIWVSARALAAPGRRFPMSLFLGQTEQFGVRPFAPVGRIQGGNGRHVVPVQLEVEHVEVFLQTGGGDG